MVSFLSQNIHLSFNIYNNVEEFILPSPKPSKPEGIDLVPIPPSPTRHQPEKKGKVFAKP
jgi:hypothetical protein